MPRNRQKRGWGKRDKKRGGRKVGPARLPEQFYGLKDFGRLEDYVKARLADFRKNILGTDLVEPGLC